jgi:hypothetical protein
MAIGASTAAHFDRKLIAMGVVVAVDATLCPDVQVVAGSLALVAARAADRLMISGQRKLGAAVLLHGEQSRPKSVLVMAAPAIGRSEAASMDVAMTVRALLKLQTPVPPLHWELRQMTTIARDPSVQTLQWKCCLRMRAEPDLFRQPHPANAGMTVLAPVSELRFVHLRVAGHALRSRAGSRNVALVVTGLALRLGVACCEAQTRMISPDVGDFAPIGFVVARSAFLSGKGPLVRILVTGHTLGLQAEKRGVTAPVLTIVTVLTANRCMSTSERPTRLTMVEALFSAARPPDESRVPSEMLDVASAAVLAAILAPVQSCLLPYLGAQVIVAPKASIRVDPFARRVTFAAVRIAIDLGMATSELPRGQKLGAGRPGHQRSGNRGHYHQAADDGQSGDAPPHSEKIQRYP